MNKIYRFIALIPAWMLLSSLQTTPVYYYAFEKKVYLDTHPTKVIVRLKSKTDVTNLLRGVDAEWRDGRTVVANFAKDADRDLFISRNAKHKDVQTIFPMYLIDKLEAGLTNEILVQFKKGISAETMDGVAVRYNLTLLQRNEIFDKYSVPSGADALSIANTIHESGISTFSYPNFVSVLTPNSTPNDSYYANQYYLNNTGQTVNGYAGTSNADINAPEAWDLTTGSSSVTVAVLDGGVTSNHPDLPNARQARLNGSNFGGDGSVNDPSPISDLNGGHGNGVAGIIGATQNNGEGISGICPSCTIMPVRIFNTMNANTDPSSVANAILFAVNNGASVINISASYPSADPNTYPAIVSAISYAVTNGRSGKGCVVVISIGNSADHAAGPNYAGYIPFPGNVNISGVVSVGASDSDNHQANYSPTATGATNNQLIDVVAPSASAFDYLDVWTTDTPSTSGINPVPFDWTQVDTNLSTGTSNPSSGTNYQSYTAYFGGTSAAAAEVSGVAALMLSVNPNLTQQAVYDILTGTADKVGSYTYTSGRSNELGYGKINACSAVFQTISGIVSLSQPSLICSTGQFTVNNLPSSASVSWVSSDNGILTVNSSGFATIVSNGLVTVGASITMSCGGIWLVSTQMYVGVPAQPQQPANPPTPICVGASKYASLSAVAGASSYSWTASNTHIDLGTPCGGVSCATGLNNLVDGYSAGNSDIYITANNDCGSSSTTTVHVGVINCGGGGGGHNNIAIFPNPTADKLTISNEPSTDGSESAGTDPEDQQEYSIQLIDKLQRPLKFASSRQGKVILDTSDLTTGIYYLNVTIGSEMIRRQVWIQR
jgi:subtilisin family serine protease